ncbi:hypothetical protein Tco_1362848 [Tanacetum coccineum]
MTLRARVGLLEQHDVVTRDLLRISRGRITRSELRALRCRVEYTESFLERSHERQTGDRAHTQRNDMTEQDIEASRTRAEAAKQQAETLQVSLGAARIDVRDLIESREADRLHLGKGYPFWQTGKSKPEQKYLSDESLVILLDEIQIDDNLHFVEEPMEIIDREVKRLKQSRIPIVMVRWDSRRGPEFTWERED